MIGSIVPVSSPQQVASRSVLPSTFGRGAGGEGSENVAHLPPTVGRITGMVDCRWEERSGFRVQGSDALGSKPQAPRPKTPVSLGDRFALTSGLMEITYDTGAKVILQGPVTYDVESAAGGYLSVGKLTGKLDKDVGGRGTGDESSLHPSSFILHPFVIRTPTATLTDLGTEFGVEVSKEGYTTSHVFRGLVRLQVASADGKTEGITKVLHENESARVENRGNQSGGNCIAMLGRSANPANFVRQIPKRAVKIFDLVNVVAGGDGFSGRRNKGIDPTTGAFSMRPQ